MYGVCGGIKPPLRVNLTQTKSKYNLKIESGKSKQISGVDVEKVSEYIFTSCPTPLFQDME